MNNYLLYFFEKKFEEKILKYIYIKNEKNLKKKFIYKNLKKNL